MSILTAAETVGVSAFDEVVHVAVADAPAAARFALPKLVLAVPGLGQAAGAISFLTSPLFRWIVVGVVIATLFGLTYWRGYEASTYAHQVEDQKRSITALQEQVNEANLELAEQQEAADTARAAADTADARIAAGQRTIAALRTKVAAAPKASHCDHVVTDTIHGLDAR